MSRERSESVGVILSPRPLTGRDREGRASGAATIGFDFPLSREPNAEEADDIAATVAREMYSAEELADPRTVTDPDDPRYTPPENDAGFTIFPSGVVGFLN